MATNTTNFNFIKPAVNDVADQDLWGGYLNKNWDNLDSFLKIARDTLVTTKTGAYAITSSDRNGLIQADATSGAFNISLPTAASVGNGFFVSVKKIDSSSNAITIDPNGSETIDGESTKAISEQFETLSLVSDGSNWKLLSNSLNFASEAEAIAGTNNEKVMTPFTTRKATEMTFDSVVSMTGASSILLSNSIPAGVNLVMVDFYGVSAVDGSGLEAYEVQIGDSGGLETAGYQGGNQRDGGYIAASSAAPIYVGNGSRNLIGTLFIKRFDGNKWIMTGNFIASSGSSVGSYTSVLKELSGDLTQIGIKTNNASNFDLGSCVVSWIY